MGKFFHNIKILDLYSLFFDISRIIPDMKKEKVGALGGTFDHFHIGHQSFIQFAKDRADRLLIGITADQMVQDKVASSLIQPFAKRQKAVEHFCKMLGIEVEIIQINDHFGPTLGERPIDLLVVTQHTEDGAKIINKMRTKKSLPALKYDVCQMKRDEDGEVITSTRIRLGEINRSGLVYRKIVEKSHTLTNGQKESLQSPIGTLYSEVDLQKKYQTMPEALHPIVVVGDSSVEFFITFHLPYHVGVYDRKRQRREVVNQTIDGLLVSSEFVNPAGQIQKTLSRGVIDMVKRGKFQIDRPEYVLIHGEEDLAVLPFILLLPLESLIYYGQPGKGLVEVKVTEERKKFVASVLKNV